MSRRPLAILFLMAVAGAASAQAPRISVRGDPSIDDDTIYKLAVDPRDYPDQPFVVLLDDGIVSLEMDGRARTTYRQVVQILTQDGAEPWGERAFSYVQARERFAINWVRVIRPDGTTITPQPAQEQEGPPDVALQAPVYSSARVRRITLGGVAPGTIVDVSYTIERQQPMFSGEFYTSWVSSGRQLIRRSRYLLDIPAGLPIRIREHNVPAARVTDVGRRRVYTWTANDLPRIEVEPFMPEDDSVLAGVNVAAPITWDDVAAWYGALARDRYTVTPELAQQFGAQVAGARTREDSLRALYRWVAQEFRYVALELGMGGYQPRAAGDVLATKYGDCKDKATLFIALARRMGFEADPVLLSSRGAADSTMPSLAQFDHAIAAVTGGSGGYRYFDLTAELVPFGELPYAEQGSFALVVHSDGTGRVVSLPADSAPASIMNERLAGTLAPGGEFTGTYTATATGFRQQALREMFYRHYSPAEQRDFAAKLASQVINGATGSALQAFDGRDLSAEARVAFSITDPRMTSPSGGADVMTVPITAYAMGSLVAALEAHLPRKYSISVTSVVGPSTRVSELQVQLPEGWHARLPPAVSTDSRFGRYRATYTQTGRTLRIVRTMSGYRGTAPPEAVQELIAWLKAVGQDDVRFIVLEHAP
ncbi:MAG TPA: DUF3857 domain-containing protein [Gemmatimonadales bacterium]|nr:DUF3857 domain-containing protein [Gemmatimonadales bacterium]